MKNIIEVYKKRKYNEFLIEKRNKENLLQEDDKFKKLVNKYNDDLMNLLKEEKMEFLFNKYMIQSFPISDETLKKYKEIQKDFDDKIDERNRVIEEVEALLLESETAEDRMAVYKRFGIVDKAGKIYDYK